VIELQGAPDAWRSLLPAGFSSSFPADTGNLFPECQTRALSSSPARRGGCAPSMGEKAVAPNPHWRYAADAGAGFEAGAGDEHRRWGGRSGRLARARDMTAFRCGFAAARPLTNGHNRPLLPIRGGSGSKESA